MKYEVVVDGKVMKYLKKLHLDIRKKIASHIDLLSFDPRPPGCKKLKGYAKTNTYRIRHSKYRIVYRIEDQILTVLITDVDHRKDVYKKN